MGVSGGLSTLSAELAYFSFREVDKSDFLYLVARWLARFSNFIGKKWPWRGLAVGAYWILPDDLPDHDIDQIFRTAEIPLSRYAIGDHVCSLGGRHIVEEGS